MDAIASTVVWRISRRVIAAGLIHDCYDVLVYLQEKANKSEVGRSRGPRNRVTSTHPHSCELIEEFSGRCPEVWWHPILMEVVPVVKRRSLACQGTHTALVTIYRARRGQNILRIITLFIGNNLHVSSLEVKLFSLFIGCVYFGHSVLFVISIFVINIAPKLRIKKYRILKYKCYTVLFICW
jgi:hypothetical protein